MNLDEWEVEREEETAEALWGERGGDRRSKMRAKEDELRSWKENKVCRKEKHGLSTRWIMTKS